MARTFQDAWQSALGIEKELINTLAEKEPTFASITHFLSEFRIACQNAIFLDIDAACSADVEGRLWDAHVKINTRFRKLLSRFRDENGKKKPVEKRKLEKHYLDFIKSSQRFYRGYIQHLSSHFGGIPELEKVAHKFNFDNLSTEPPVNIDDDLRKRVLLSSHATLIRLGDLSRYRETELAAGKGRNWGPAIGYYDLATVINADSGASHNQLAVIALADNNHLRATYHLYRALSAQEPYPTSKGNLEIEFRKIITAWTKRELIPREDAGIPGKALTPWFVYLHARCYKGAEFPEHDELENEVLSQLAVDLKERSLEGTLQKFCMINVAAEDYAQVRSVGELTQNSRLFFQRINVKTFFTLLQILLGELERFAVEDSEGKDMENGSDRITAVARRVLPALRQYSSWLLTNSGALNAQKQDKDTSLSIQIKEFWKIYANTLTLLASTFDVTSLPEVEYLLEEDEESLGFRPLINEATTRRYLGSRGQRKPRMNDRGVERNHPNTEMLYRIREFVIDGLDLVVNSRIPVALVDEDNRKIFIYQEEGLPSQFYTNSSPPGHRPTLSSTSIERDDIRQAQQPTGKGSVDNRSVFGGSQSASVSMSANMNRIVEGVERLVESDTNEGIPELPELPEFLREIPTSSNNAFGRTPSGFYETSPYKQAISGTPQAGLAPPASPNPTFQGHPSPSFTPRPALPSIPSIWNTTPISPLPPRATSPQNRPSTARQVNSGFATSQQQTLLAASSHEPSLPSQEPSNSDLAFRNDIRSYQRHFEPSGGDASSDFTSSFVGPIPLAAPYEAQPLHSTWDPNFQSTFSGSVHDLETRFTSSQMPNRFPSGQIDTSSSWPNNAFIASSLHDRDPLISGQHPDYVHGGNASTADRFGLRVTPEGGGGRSHQQFDNAALTPPSGQEG